MVDIDHLPSSLTKITHHHDVSTSSTASIPSILSPMEAESIISSIHEFPIQEIGSSSFLKLYGFEIEKLSLQAHASATNAKFNHNLPRNKQSVNNVGGEDEYVIDLLLTHDKVKPLVQTLLAIEAWRTFVLGSKEQDTQSEEKRKNEQVSICQSDDYRLMEKIAKQGNSLRVAFTLHTETTIVSLLTLMFFRRENVMDVENDVLLSIVDYCARHLSSLAAPLCNNEMVKQQKEPRLLEQMKSKAIHQQLDCSLDDIRYNLFQTEFQTAVKATSLARYLCEHFDSLSISIQSRILNTHDFLMLFVPLIDEPPWTRRCYKTNYVDSSKSGNEVLVWEKYVEQEWIEIQPGELLNITQCEAQCWIALFHLTCSNAACREQYALNTYRKEQILRLRKFLNQYMMDQLPILVDVSRYMDQLSLMHVPESANGVGMAVLMEQVDQLREFLFSECQKDWDQVAMYQFETLYSKITDSTDEDLLLIANIYNEENVGLFLGDYFPDTASKHDVKLDISVCNVDHDSDDFVDVFTLTPDSEDECTIVQTPFGPFRRMKLIVKPTGDFMQFGRLFDTRLKLQAKLSFKGVADFKQLITTLSFPKDAKSTKQVEWIQLGKLEDNLVVQLGFRRNDVTKSYTLEQSYMAKPSEDKSSM